MLRKPLNAFHRWRAGLPARGGVSPEVPNDAYQALLAVYGFASRYAAGRRVLDLRCGTGYGSAHLREAAEVVGLDPGERNLAYARKRFPGVRFLQAETPPEDLGTFGLILAVDLLAHLQSPAAVVEWAAGHLEPDGVFAASVPPILDEHMMGQNKGSGLYKVSLYLWSWEALFRRRFREVRIYGTVPPDGLDLASPSPSRFGARDFRFEEVPPDRPVSAGTLSAVLVGRGPAGQAG
jgi:SAM-dependent methyltransferase